MPPRELPRPMELAALKGRLLRARAAETAIGVTGKRLDKVLDEIDEAHATIVAHAGSLENYSGDLKATIDRITGGSNNPPTKEADGHGSNGADKPADVKPGDA